MNYYKKVLVLKEVAEGYSVSGKPVSGIARIEWESGVLTVHLSFINVAVTDGGSYYAFLKCGKNKSYFFDLGKRPVTFRTTITDDLDFGLGISTSLFFIRNDLPVMVAYSQTEDFPFSPSDVKKTVIDKCILSVKQNSAPKKISSASDRNVADSPVYDDDVVATENYYDLDADFTEKLKFIESLDNDTIPNKNGMSDSDGEKEKKENDENFNRSPNETDPDPCKKYSKDKPYYLTVKSELDGIFLKFPEEPCLIRNVPDSQWVKIYYSENKYYVVGLVKENGNEKYVCYGVPSKYSPTPPETLKGFCSFVPASVFDLTGDGYWMMFQDAVTGECVKTESG